MREVYRDTDKVIEEDDAGNVTTTWTNPRADGARLAAVDTDEPHTLSSLAGRVARIEEHLWPAPPDPESPEEAPEWSGEWPAGGLLRDGGKVWRNVTTVPLTTPPSGFPGTPEQWTHLFVEVIIGTVDPDPDPDPVWPNWRGEWSATATYAVGDHVTRGGIVYRCLVAHGAAYAGTWGPPTTGVWVIATAP